MQLIMLHIFVFMEQKTSSAIGIKVTYLKRFSVMSMQKLWQGKKGFHNA